MKNHTDQRLQAQFGDDVPTALYVRLKAFVHGIEEEAEQRARDHAIYLLTRQGFKLPGSGSDTELDFASARRA